MDFIQKRPNSQAHAQAQGGKMYPNPQAGHQQPATNNQQPTINSQQPSPSASSRGEDVTEPMVHVTQVVHIIDLPNKKLYKVC